MRSSATGSRTENAARHRARHGASARRGRARGFTLIELIVVVSIVATLALALGLATGPAIDRARPGNVTHAAGALVRDVEAARAHALHARQPAGLVPLGQGWAVVIRAPDGGGWAPAGQEATAAASLQWQIAGASHLPAATMPATAPPIRFLADGRATPFRVRLSGRGGVQICQTDGLEPLSCRAR